MSSSLQRNDSSIPSSQNQSTIKFRGDTSSRRESKSSTKKSIDEKLKERELKQKNERKNLVLYSKPIRVLSLFLSVSMEYLLSLFNSIMVTPIIMIILFPILFIILFHLILSQLIGLNIFLISYLYIYIEWILWWLILGILSSIGLGTGMHSGLLFLFPFIGQVCMVAATCHSLSFHTFGDNAFICISKNNESQSTVTFYALFIKVYWPCFLWGAGTAIGEIPPYALSLAAVRAGKQDEFDCITDELEELKRNKLTIFIRIKLWMIYFLEEYGFWAVLAFAAWPNMAFDMAGIACGHFEMSFWTFFSATFIGKAIIKINIQCIFFIIMFNEKTLNKFINYMQHFGFKYISNAATDFFETQRNIILGNHIIENKSTPIFKIIWSLIVVIFILMFITSTIQIFAQQKQKKIHEKENQIWLKAQIGK